MTFPKFALRGLTLSDVAPAAFVTSEQTLTSNKTGKKSMARRPVWRLSLQFPKRYIMVVMSVEKVVILFRL